jgi:hypothetical protein
MPPARQRPPQVPDPSGRSATSRSSRRTRSAPGRTATSSHVQDNRQDVRVFARDGLPELERLLRDGRAAALEFRDLSRSLRENPSRLIYQTKSEAVEIPP